MRNLKRALSLALAAIMLLGMMVVGAGAVSYNDFSDRTEIVNKDAVSMLTTLGVIDGKPDGSYAPEEFVTREQMAKMISVIMNQGSDNNDLFVGVPSGLTDVAGNWALGHINYCYSLGIIAGRGDGRFDPTANVTASEAAKMLLVAAGYNPSSEGFVGADWAVNVNAKASALGIFRNYTKSTMADLNRDDAALLIYNALDVEMIQKYEDGYAISFTDHRTILAAMYGVYKVEGVVVANQWARLEGTDSSAALREGRTTLENVVEYSSTTNSTTVEEGIRYNEPITFNVDTTVDMMGKTVTLFIEKTTILSNSKVLGVSLKDDVNVVNATTANKTTLADYLKGTGVDVDRDTRYYVNYGYMGNGNNNGASAAIAAINEHPNRDLSHTDTEYFNVNGVSVEVIDNNDDGLAEYVLYRMETLSEVNRYNDKAETITIYMPKRTNNQLTGDAETKTRDFEDVVFEDEVNTDDLILYIEYGGRTYIKLADIITGVMSRVDRDSSKEMFITVEGEEYRQSYIPDAASMVDADLTHFDIDHARKDDMVGFTTTYDFILDSTGEYVVAVRPAEEKESNYALVIGSAWTLNALDRSGQVKILKADGTEATYKINWNRSDDAFAGITNINNQVVTGKTNSEKLELYLGTRDVNQSGDATQGGTYNKANLAVGSVIRYTLSSDDILTIDWVMQGNTWANNTSLEIENTATNKTTAGVGDNGRVLYLGSDYNNFNLQYQTRTKYENGEGTLAVKGIPAKPTSSPVPDKHVGDSIDRSGSTFDKNYAIDLNTVAFYYWVDAKGDTKYGVATGWDDMSNVDISHDLQVYPVLDKADNRTYKATNLAEVVLFEAELKNDSANYALVLNANAASKDTWELNVVFEDGTVDAITVDDDDLGDFRPENPNHFMRAWSYTQKASGAYKMGRMYEGVEADSAYPGVDKSHGRGEAYLLRTGTVDFDPETRTNEYIALSGRANIWDVNDVEDENDSTVSSAFTKTRVNAVIIVDNGAIRTAWIWDIPGAADDEDKVYGFNDVIEYQTGKLLVQHYAPQLTAYQVSTLIRDYMHEKNSHVATVEFDAKNNRATVTYDDSTIIDVLDVTLDRVYAYDITVNDAPTGASFAINGTSYRNGDTAYLGSVSPVTGAAAPYDFTAKPATAIVRVAGNTIAVNNAAGTLTISDVSNPADGNITVVFGAKVPGGTPVIPESPEEANDILAGGGNVEINTPEIPDGETPEQGFDTVLNPVDPITGEDSGSVTFKDTSVATGKKVLVNGTATVAPGTFTVSKGASLEVTELILEPGAILQLNGTLICQNLVLKAGSIVRTPGANTGDADGIWVIWGDMRIEFNADRIADLTDGSTLDTINHGDGVIQALTKANTMSAKTTDPKDSAKTRNYADLAAEENLTWFFGRFDIVYPAV